jgi:hypothetical protein
MIMQNAKRIELIAGLEKEPGTGKLSRFPEHNPSSIVTAAVG